MFVITTLFTTLCLSTQANGQVITFGKSSIATSQVDEQVITFGESSIATSQVAGTKFSYKLKVYNNSIYTVSVNFMNFTESPEFIQDITPSIETIAPNNSAEYTLTGVFPEGVGTHSKEITAFWTDVDNNSRFGQATVTFSVITKVADPVLPPAVPTNVVATNPTVNSCLLSWTNCDGATAYRVYNYGGTYITNTTNSYITITDLLPNTQYGFKVTSYNGVESNFSSIAYVATLPDNTPPTAPTNLSFGSVNATNFTVNWSASTDNDKVAGYEVVCNGVTTRTTVATCTFSSASPLTIYNIKVRAYDRSNNYSPYAFINVATAPSASTVISGPSTVCSTTSSFSIPNLPQGVSIIWTTSSNISIVGSNSSTTLTAQPATTTTSGSGTISATLTLNGQTFPIPPVSVWVGKPTTPTSIGNMYSGKVLGSDGDYTFYTTTPASSYSWSVSGGTITDGQNTHTIIVHTIKNTSSIKKYFTIGVKTVNGCGYSPYFVLNGYVSGISGPVQAPSNKTIPSNTIFPNPSNDEIHISLNRLKEDFNTLKANNIETSGPTTISIYDGNGKLAIQQVIKESEVTIPTSTLANGWYIVHISYSGNTYSAILQIQH